MPSPTTLQDPAGLLERVPDLRPLCADRWVRRALASGDPLKVYRSLFYARLTGRLSANRHERDRLLRTRRAFARPVRKHLYLGSWDGLGAGFVGSAERKEDGTRIATHALEFLFGIPIFPLGAYIVAKAPPKGDSDRWYIHARVPLGPFAWAWSRGLALAGVLLVAVMSGVFPGSERDPDGANTVQDVVVVNGFEQTIRVTIGPIALDLPGGQHNLVSIPTGTQTARAVTAEGEVVDEGPLEVRRTHDLLVWNVAGAAPVVEREVEYFTEGVPDAPPPERPPVFHCGERWLGISMVDYAFVEPPSTLTHVGHAAPHVVQRAVRVDTQEGVDGALRCAWLIADQNKDWPGAEALLERRARAARWRPDAVEQAVLAARRVSAEEEQRVLQAARDAHRGELEELPPNPAAGPGPR